MPNCVITWLAWRANPVAFLDVLLRWNALCVYLSIVSTAGNFISNDFQTTHLT